MSGSTNVLEGVVFYGVAFTLFMGLGAAFPRGKRLRETPNGVRDNYRLQRRLYGAMAAIGLAVAIGAARALGVVSLA